MSELSTDEKLYYVKKLEEARDIVLSLPGGTGATTDLVVAVFEKIASPLYFLRQGGFSHETPTLNDEKVPSNENENEGNATIGYERKARLLKEGWKEMPKYTNIVYKTVGNLTFFEDTRDGRTWISKHAEVEK